MPTITINGKECEFDKGQMVLQVALANGIEIPHYCYHPCLSIVASCRVCLVEVWAPNPRNDNAIEPIPKLLPACQTPAGDQQIVYSDSPKAILNQKAVMEYLLINHPIDCPVCDQAGECYLQDYSYQYGRGQVRFEEEKIKQPKKDIGPHVLLYSDRCIMCTRCVRFCREITGTGELMVDGRGSMEQIDIFPGQALDNELSANVVDLCPVGALLDKDFLFQQRVWFLKKTPSIDGLTCSGDNIYIEHNKGQIYRIKPRTNLDVNRHWITDELRYGWKFIHDENRLTVPAVSGEDAFEPNEASLAYEAAYTAANDKLAEAKKIALLISPMLSCEDAYLLATYASQFDGEVIFGIGPVPTSGEDKEFLDGFKLYAEKAPNARGVRRVLSKFGDVLDFNAFVKKLADADSLIATGNYPADWVEDELTVAAGDKFVMVIDTLPNGLTKRADVLIPAATWAEKAGTFENASNRLQTFDRAIDPIDYCKGESQIALDLIALRGGLTPDRYDAAAVRQKMAETHGLSEFVSEVQTPCEEEEAVKSDMEMVVL